ncbi:MAG: RNA-binding protein [Devosiaceae bacterium]|nr:RNA-binding protein [Devosiaceae bacterium]
MPKGPQGQKRPADAIGAAVMVARIATGEIEDNKKSGRVRSGKAGAKARANSLSAERRSEIAKIAAQARHNE